MIDLHYSVYSVASEKVFLCLFEKDLEFRGHLVNLFTFDQLSPAYHAINPDGTVPTLVHESVVVRDSTFILEYLDETFGAAPLRPSDAYERARMRLWLREADAVLHLNVATLSHNAFIAPIWREMWPRERLEALIASKPDPERIRRQLRAVRNEMTADDIAAAKARIVASLARMEADLAAGGPWLLGSYSLADIAVAPMLCRLERLGMADLWHDRLMGVSAWFARVSARPAYARAMNYAPLP